MQSNAALKIDGEPTRGPHNYQTHPSPEMILVAGGIASPNGLLSVTAGGKTTSFELTRKQMMGLAEQVMGALKRMEPGK